MEIKFDKSQGWSSFQSEILKAKDGVELLREQIIRQCSVTGATLIGLIAVFGKLPQGDSVLRWLTISSVLLLFLSVIAGVLYSFLYVSLNLKQLTKSIELYRQGGGEGGSAPAIFRVSCQNLPMADVCRDASFNDKCIVCVTIVSRKRCFF